MDPTIEFRATPTTFSEVSHVERVLNGECRSGIILDSPAAVGDALLAFAGVSIPGSSTLALMNDLGDLGGGAGAAYIATAGVRNGGFVHRVAKAALDGLTARGQFHGSYDYDAMGTPFFKSAVNARRENDKYLLEVSVVGAGRLMEDRLAQALGAQRALVRADAIVELSTVDTWWFDLPLERLLARVPFPQPDYAAFAQHLVDHYTGRPTDLTFTHDGHAYDARIRIDGPTYQRPRPLPRPAPRSRAPRRTRIVVDDDWSVSNDGLARFVEIEDEEESLPAQAAREEEPLPHYLQARGTYVVGASWTDYDENGDRCAPTPRPTRLALYVTLPKNGLWERPAVAPDAMTRLLAARDHARTWFE